MLSNFLFNICGFEKTTMDNIIEQKVEEISPEGYTAALIFWRRR